MTIPPRTELTPAATWPVDVVWGFGGSRDMRALNGGQGLAGNQRDTVRTCYRIISSPVLTQLSTIQQT